MPCNNNVFCDPANLPQDVYDINVRSSIKIAVPGSGGQCSCVLLRQARTDDNLQENIILTSRHCIRSGNTGAGPIGDLSQAKFTFNYSSPDCGNSTLASENNYTLFGATVIIESSIVNVSFVVIKLVISEYSKYYIFL